MDKSRICQTCSASACGSLQYNSDTHTYYCPVFNIGYVENPIEAFMSKQPCDKCLFQNTPNCKILGIGVNGEMGCTFKERVRMSELEEKLNGHTD